MAATIRLIATDLDGTLIGSADEVPIYSEFAAKINQLRASNGALWAVFSGRSLRSYLAYLRPMLKMGIEPDYVILKYSYIYRRVGPKYQLCIAWSLYTLWQRLLRPVLTRRLLDEWHDAAATQFRGARTAVKLSDRILIRFKSEEAAQSAAAALQAKASGYDHVKAVVDGTEVEVRAFLSLKGMALRELTRRLGLSADSVLAIGNGYHDLSMLDEQNARFTGCPANSHARVIERVHQLGGHVAGQRALAGVLEILNAYVTDSVNSSLPASWRPVSGLRQRTAPLSTRWTQRKRKILRYCALAVVAYAILMAFAVFDLFPYAWIVMKPYDMIVTWFTKIVSWL